MMNAVDAIKKLGAEYAAAHQEGDGKAMARLFRDDAVIIPPGKPAIVGREEIDEFFAGVTGGTGLHAETENIAVEGPLAYNYGTVSWDENGGRRLLCFVDVYRLEGGEWKLQLVSWNTSEGIAE